ncbi:transmembrane protein, putative (macronuclear) [Tetrahymena thermophila SB210]|uniref:Transmembrane protein, putative n=1 Tax=Tetrahymena thermophila (strain SB210) TaxID=312017 RepID=W7X7U3_TETTS|nr:transmembrane protein, putative [Tetrahymena thermophila SB210]EWS72493.1 transmembrane protein, putative [Tetrahymena thermophila SB210]|eukprot:XP_012654990.1 transmembrane protein, putative [Tetrahymena thermophila SB210]
MMQSPAESFSHPTQNILSFLRISLQVLRGIYLALGLYYSGIQLCQFFVTTGLFSFKYSSIMQKVKLNINYAFFSFTQFSSIFNVYQGRTSLLQTPKTKYILQIRVYPKQIMARNHQLHDYNF